MFRFSLRIVFAVVALVAVVLYSVINYSPWLCTVYCNVLALALITAAVGAIAFGRATRAFSAGFLAAAAFCTWTAFGRHEVYYGPSWLYNSPPPTNSFAQRLATDKLVRWTYEAVHGNYDYVGGNRDLIYFADGTMAQHREADGAYVSTDGRRVVFPREVFETTSHCILAIILGLIAGTAAAVVWSAADRRRSRLTSRQSLVAVRSEAEPRNEDAREVPSP